MKKNKGTITIIIVLVIIFLTVLVMKVFFNEQETQVKTINIKPSSITTTNTPTINVTTTNTPTTNDTTTNTTTTNTTTKAIESISTTSIMSTTNQTTTSVTETTTSMQETSATTSKATTMLSTTTTQVIKKELLPIRDTKSNRLLLGINTKYYYFLINIEDHIAYKRYENNMEIKYKKLLDNVESVDYDDDVIICYRNSLNYNLYLYNIESESQNSFVSSYCNYYYILDDYVYYSTANGIYRKNIKTKENEELSTGNYTYFQTYGENIYALEYSNKNTKLVVININEEIPKYLIPENVSSFLVYDNLIYYKSNNSIYSYSILNNVTKQLSSSDVSQFTF